MRDSHYRITLDITKTQSQVSLPVKKGDTSRKIYISLVEGSQPYEIDGTKCTAVFHGIKSDGTKLEEFCIIEGNTIRYDFTEQTTAAVGLVECDITLHNIETGVIASPHFCIIVDDRAIEPGVLSENETITFDEVLTVLGDVRNAEAGRILNEEDRVGAETKRVSNEQTRIANEEDRNANEETRKKAAQSLANLNTRVTNAENERNSAEEARQEAEKNRQAMWNNSIENPKVWELNPGCYYVSGMISISSYVSFPVYDKTILYIAPDDTDETKKRFVVFLGYAHGMPFDVLTGTTDGETEEFYIVETNKNKTTEITEDSTDEQYPTAKAVYDALLAQAIDIKVEPFEEAPEYGGDENITPVAYTMRNVPMTASEPVALGENVIPYMGLGVVSGGTLVSDVDDVITVTHDGSSGTVIGLQQTSSLNEDHPQATGDIWYMGAKITAEKYYWEDGAKSEFPVLQIYVRDASKEFKYIHNAKTTTEEATDYYGTFEVGADSSKGFGIVAYRVQYMRAEYVAGRTCSFSDIVLVNLTEAYGKGNEPTAEEYHAMLVGSSEGDGDSGDSGESGGGDIPGGDTGGGDDSGDSGNDNPGGSTDVVSDSGYKLTITTANGTETLYLYQGQPGNDGKDGANGKDGKDGKNGADGVSPTINVEEIEGGNRLTIADKNGEQTIDLMNAPPIDTELREDVTDAIGETTSLVDLTDTLVIETGSLNASTGQIVASVTDGRATQPFKVEAGETYHVWGGINTIFCLIALYDENKSFIAPVCVGTQASTTKVENEIYVVPEKAIDKDGNERNVAYMACSTKLIADKTGIDLAVKREIIKYNNLSETVSNAIEDSSSEKLDKVLCSPNGAEWVLTITNEGVIKAVKRRNTSGGIITTLTLPTNLSIGTYALRYENSQGALIDYADICSVEVTSEGDIAVYNGLIAENCAPSSATSIGVYDSNGTRIEGIELGFLQNDYSEKLYSFAALSDVHIGDKEHFPTKFETAIDDIDNNNDIAFTVICGDMVDNANDVTQLETYQSIVKGLNKPVYVTMGNHEMVNAITKGKTFDDIKEYFKQDNHDINQKLYFSFSPEGSNDVFIMFGISGLYSKYAALSIEQLQWLYETLEENRNKRCFLFHHYFPYDGSGDAVNCYNQNGLQGTRGDLFYDLLKHYKNVIYFHGHTHAKFKIQELNSMNTIDNIFGRYSVHIPSLTCPTEPNEAMNAYVEDSNAGEGYIIDVYEHGIALRGKDFKNGTFLPIGSYYLDTITQKVEANSYRDSTGILSVRR